MLTHLQKPATTAPKVLAAIQARDTFASDLAEQFGTTEQTVCKWPHREGGEDHSRTPKRPQTTLMLAQEAVVLCRTLLVPLDDFLSVVREFLNSNGLRCIHNRCLWRHGVGNLRDLKAKAPQPKRSAFKAYVSGYIHLDFNYLPQIADEPSRRCLFVVIARATRWVFIWILRTKTTTNARRFLRDLERVCGMRIRTVPSDNGKEFTRCLFGLRKRATTGEHAFDKPCTTLEIKHRLTPPKSPQSELLSAIGKRTIASGIVEHFNGCIDQMMQSHHLRSGEEHETMPHRYVWLLNRQLAKPKL